MNSDRILFRIRRFTQAFVEVLQFRALQKRMFVLDGDQYFFLAYGVIQIFELLVLYLLFQEGHTEHDESIIYMVLFGAAPVMALVCHIAILKLPLRKKTGLTQNTLIVSVIPAIILLIGSVGLVRLIYYSYAENLQSPPFSIFRFVVGCAIATVFFSVVIYILLKLRQSENFKRARFAVYLIGFAVIVGLFDANLRIDTLSYSPYVAPAWSVRNGLVPLIDVFSQYGLNYLLFTAAFSVKSTIYIGAVVVAVLNVLMYVTVAFLAIRLGIDRLLSFVLMVFFILFAHSAYLYNINYTPSVFAMRFLPPMLLVLSLVHLPAQRTFNASSVVSLMVCSLWSIEAFLFGLLTYGTYLLIYGISLHRKLVELFCSGLLLILFSIVPHLVLTATYCILFSTLPRYDIYLELVFTNLSRGNYWLLLIETGVQTWILFNFFYASALGLAIHKALTVEHIDYSKVQRIAGIGTIAVLGALEFYYYVGRSATPILLFISLPILLLLALAIDWAADSWRRTKSTPLLAIPMSVLAVFILITMSGVSADRFFRPISRDLSNSTILRACLSMHNREACNVTRILSLVSTNADRQSWTYPSNEAGGSPSYMNRAVYVLVQKYVQQDRRIILLLTDPVPVIFYTPISDVTKIIYPPHNIGVVYPAVDGLSPTLTSRALAVIPDMRAGDILIRDELPIYALDEAFLSLIQKTWILCKIAYIETTAQTFVRAYELQSLNMCDNTPERVTFP